MSEPASEKTLRNITLEEHYVTPAFMEGPGADLPSASGQHRANLRSDSLMPIWSSSCWTSTT